MLSDAVHETFKFFQFHQIVALVDWLVFGYVFFLLFELLISLEVDFLCYEVLLLGELLHSQINSFLELDYFFFEPFNFLSDSLHMVIMLFVLIKSPC